MTGGESQLENKESFREKVRNLYRKKTFVAVDYFILAVVVIVFVAAWFGITRGSNIVVSGNFYSEGFTAEYELEGTVADELGADKLTVTVAEEGDESATLEITYGDNTETLVVDKETAKVTSDTQTDVPVIFFYDIVRMPQEVSATFEKDRFPNFSTELTPLEEKVHARVKEKNDDNVVMWYHTSGDKDYGPQFSWELPLYNLENVKVGRIINDVTSGLLLRGEFYQDGWGAMTLSRTNYPTGANRWAIFYGLNIILLVWGVYHILRARKHKDEWEAHWSHFDLNFVGISRFFIRLLAFTTFGFLGVGVLTGNLTLIFILELIGFALMIYAVGPFAFPIVFLFIPWIASFGVFAGGRSMDYVQYPFGVPIYLTAVVSYLFYRYLCYRKQQQLKVDQLVEQLPEVSEEDIKKEIAGVDVGAEE